MDYKTAGVNIALADSLINKISSKSDQIGKFAANFTLDKKLNRDLVASCDGVGTKILLALEAKRKYNRSLKSIGQDCVAMVINDILCENAEPLFFMDYLSTSKLNESDYLEIIQGIQDACEYVNIPLIGGETAELPGMFTEGSVDVCGFAVGTKHFLDFSKVELGDLVIGIHSTGVHSNGFSLVRKLLIEYPVCDEHMEQLLEPTQLYHNHIKMLRSNFVDIKAIAHITGGGFSNINRVLSKLVTIQYYDADPFYEHEEIFKWIQNKSQLSNIEMQNTFNCGIGMMVVIPATRLKDIPFSDYSVLGKIIPCS